jgi:hypothetical protein
VSTTSATVYPVRDRYLDTTVVSTTLGEAARTVRLEVRTRAGRLVHAQGVGSQQPGRVEIGWNGRTRGGSMVAPGTYRARVVAEDRAGNRRASAAVAQSVSGQRTVRRRGTMEVTARQSLTESFSDECSLVFRHTDGKRKGWVGYYSSGTCTSGDAYALGDHQVRLPEAVRYGTVRVSAHGGRGDPRYRDSARITYYDRYQNASDATFRLAPAVGTYTGPKVSAARHLFRGRVFRWSTSTTGVAWYDVDRYTVRFTYDVLR